MDFVLRNFADLGGRAPRKELRESLHRSGENPNPQHRLLKFALDIGFETERIRMSIENDPREQQLQSLVGQIFKLQPSPLERCG